MRDRRACGIVHDDGTRAFSGFRFGRFARGERKVGQVVSLRPRGKGIRVYGTDKEEDPVNVRCIEFGRFIGDERRHADDVKRAVDHGVGVSGLRRRCVGGEGDVRYGLQIGTFFLPGVFVGRFPRGVGVLPLTVLVLGQNTGDTIRIVQIGSQGGAGPGGVLLLDDFLDRFVPVRVFETEFPDGFQVDLERLFELILRLCLVP